MCKTVTHIIPGRDDPRDLAGRPAPLSPAPLSSRPIPAAGRKAGNSTSLTTGVAHLGAVVLSRSLAAPGLYSSNPNYMQMADKKSYHSGLFIKLNSGCLVSHSNSQSTALFPPTPLPPLSPGDTWRAGPRTPPCQSSCTVVYPSLPTVLAVAPPRKCHLSRW